MVQKSSRIQKLVMQLGAISRLTLLDLPSIIKPL